MIAYPKVGAPRPQIPRRLSCVLRRRGQAWRSNCGQVNTSLWDAGCCPIPSWRKSGLRQHALGAGLEQSSRATFPIFGQRWRGVRRNLNACRRASIGNALDPAAKRTGIAVRHCVMALSVCGLCRTSAVLQRALLLDIEKRYFVLLGSSRLLRRIDRGCSRNKSDDKRQTYRCTFNHRVLQHYKTGACPQ